jgi:hypothetical protein
MNPYTGRCKSKVLVDGGTSPIASNAPAGWRVSTDTSLEASTGTLSTGLQTDRRNRSFIALA